MAKSSGGGMGEVFFKKKESANRGGKESHSPRMEGSRLSERGKKNPVEEGRTGDFLREVKTSSKSGKEAGGNFREEGKKEGFRGRL